MGYDLLLAILIIILIIFLLILVASRVFYLALFKPSTVYATPPPPEVQTVAVDSITGWLYNPFPQRPIIIYFHGYSENISYRRDILHLCEHMRLNIFLFDYRGYGHSPGEPSMSGLLEDAESAYKYVRDQVHSTHIYLWAESLGASPAFYIAAHYPVEGFIVYSGFPGVATYASYTTYIPSPILWLVEATDQFPVNQWATKVRSPVFYMASESDDMIPYSCSQYIYSLIPAYKTFCTIKGDHRYPVISCNDVWHLVNFFGIDTSHEQVEACKGILKSIAMNSIN